MDQEGVRVSDQERDRVAAEIREHYAAGRLSEEEFDERVSAAYAARTQGQLEALRRDLPALPPSVAEQRAELATRRSRLQRQMLQQTGGGLLAFVICTLVWLAAGAHGGFWPVWVALAPAITLLRGGWLLYGPSPELERLERELEARSSSRDRDERREARSQRRLKAREERRRLPGGDEP